MIFIKKYLILLEKNYKIALRHWACSSAGLERLPVTQKVAGSSPVNPASFFVLSFWPYRLMVRTPPFQGENPGSNPSGAAKINKSGSTRFFYFAQKPHEDRSEYRRYA